MHMIGMLQIITDLLAFYLVVKGVEVLLIGLASNRENRNQIILVGKLTLAACVIAALSFTSWQDNQASTISKSMPNIPSE